jgi:hypothetical protein
MQTLGFARKQHAIEVDPLGVAAGQHGRAAGRADPRGHAEVGEAHALGRHTVQGWCVVDPGSIAAQVAVPQVIAVDQDDVRFGRRWLACHGLALHMSQNAYNTDWAQLKPCAILSSATWALSFIDPPSICLSIMRDCLTARQTGRSLS